MKTTKFKKGLSLFLSVLMLVTMMPLTGLVLEAGAAYPTIKAFTSVAGDFHAYKAEIVTVTFLDYIDEAEYAACSPYAWDVSASAETGTVKAWMKVNAEETAAAGATRYDVYIGGEGGVAANAYSADLFWNFNKLKEIRGLEKFDTSNATNFNYMFNQCESLESLDLSSWDTSKAKSFLWMFHSCYALKTLILSGWDTSNVTTMDSMFKNCRSLIELDISSFDTSNVTNMYQLFYNCVTLKYLYVGEGWNIGNVKNGAQAFSCCDALPGFDPNNSAVDISFADKYVKPEEEKPKPETKMYTVTYEVIGDIPEGVTAPGAATYEEGATVAVAESPSADKYIFSGWKTEDLEDAEVVNGEFVINNDVEFVGLWTKLYKVTYEYDDNYDLPPVYPELPDAEYWYAPGEDVPVYGVPYAPEYMFVGWKTGDAEVIGDSFIMPENDVVLYGYYKMPVNSIEISGGELTVDIGGEKVKVEVIVDPPNATFKDVIYESGDESIVTVDKDGYLTPEGVGTTTITITSADDPTKTDTVKVTVKIPVTDITVDRTTIDLDKGDTDKITVTEVKPVEATNKDVTYESSNPDVVTVDENGNIIAVGDGTATITVTSKDNKTVKERVTVTVTTPVKELTVTEDFTLAVNETKNVDAKVNEDATNKELEYETSNPGVAKVDNEGNVIGVGEGTATITVTSKDNPSKKETVTVTVKIPVEDITVEKDEISLAEGDTDKIEVTFTPNDPTNQELIYKSDDEKVVKVDKDGNIEAAGEGETTITITSKDNPDATETVTVTVYKEYKVTYSYADDVIPAPAPLVPASAIYRKGVTVDVAAGAVANGYTFSGWSTNDADVKDGKFVITNDVHFVGSWTKINYYDVTYRYEGEVPAGAPGVPAEKTYEEGTSVTVETNPVLGGYTFSGWDTKDVTVTDGSFEIYKNVEFIGKWTKNPVPVNGIKVNKTEIELTPDGKDKITVEVKPDNADNKEVIFESSDEAVVKVDKEGNVEAVGEGEATITVTSKDNPNLKVVIPVKVEKEDVPEEPEVPEIPEEPEYVIEVPEEITVEKGITKLIYVRVTPDDGELKPAFSSADEGVARVDEFGNVTGISAGTTTVYIDFGNGTVKTVTVTVTAPPVAPVIPVKHHVCFGKTDGIGWYEVSVNGGDFFPQGPNSTLEVEEGSILVVRVQDMWIDDEFDFYVNGKKVPLDPANTITVVVDGYMLIGALSMDVPVPDAEESLNLFERIVRAFERFIEWVKSLFTRKK